MSGTQTVGTASTSGEVVGAQFDALSTLFVPLNKFSTSQNIMASQVSELTIADSTESFIRQSGTPLPYQHINTDYGALVDVTNDLLGLVTLAAGGIAAVDPILPVVICPHNNCSIPLGFGSGYTISDPINVFDYTLSLSVSQEDLALFHVGNRYIINSSLIGDHSGFSSVRIAGIDGNSVRLSISDLSKTNSVPEPEIWVEMMAGLFVSGTALRKSRSRLIRE